jgi:hypothetical protein
MRTTIQSLLPALILGAATVISQAQMFSRIVPSQGPNCAAQFPIQVIGSNLITGTYTVTLQDHNGTYAPLVSLQVDVAHGVLGAVFNLNGLADGIGFINVDCPNAVQWLNIPFTITSCPGGTGMQVRLYGASTISPVRTWQYVASVINMGPNTIGPVNTDVQVDGLAAAPDMTVSLPPGATPVGPPQLPTGQQGFTVTVSVPTLGVGDSADFLFAVTADFSAAGNTYPLGAHFTSAYSGSDSLPVTVINSMDPNDKTGPPGIGTAHYLTGNPRLAYNVVFENDGSGPAQVVVITDRLDHVKVDLNSFLFGPITFGSELVMPTLAQNPFSITHDCTVQGHDLSVQIDGSLDVDPLSSTYGLVTWTFQTFEQHTTTPPGADIGFLPSDVSPPEGQGAVSFSVSEAPGLVTGNIITNCATVVFDYNPPIITPTWTNTIVKARPSVTITNEGNQVRITWPVWVLQQADELSGTRPGSWSDAPVQTSPWIFTPTDQKKFYRLRTPD